MTQYHSFVQPDPGIFSVYGSVPKLKYTVYFFRSDQKFKADTNVKILPIIS